MPFANAVNVSTCILISFLLSLLYFEDAVAAPPHYNFDIEADFSNAKNLTNDDDCVPISVTVKQKKHRLKELSWRQNQYLSNFEADGELTQNDQEWLWQVPQRGGKLRYCAKLNHLRGERYDARITRDWALFRADDLFPAASSVALRGTESRTTMRFRLPKSWSSVAPYPQLKDHHYLVNNTERSFDRPTGWVQLGELGVRRDRIAQTRVAVSAPIGQEVTRLEILTMLSFTLPEVRDWFPQFPERLLVVSATDKLWRGALSGPSSLFLHGERPLVSENGTSTVLHELVHVGMQRQASDDADWIDEGLAEYLSVVILHQAGGLTDKRYQDALENQREWGKTAQQLGRQNSNGAATAKAVTVFAQLHQELGDQNFRKLVKQLAQSGPEISAELLKELAEALHENPIKSLP